MDKIVVAMYFDDVFCLTRCMVSGVSSCTWSLTSRRLATCWLLAASDTAAGRSPAISLKLGPHCGSGRVTVVLSPLLLPSWTMYCMVSRSCWHSSYRRKRAAIDRPYLLPLCTVKGSMLALAKEQLLALLLQAQEGCHCQALSVATMYSEGVHACLRPRSSCWHSSYRQKKVCCEEGPRALCG